MPNWKRLYAKTARTFRELKPLFDRRYASLTVKVDRRDLVVSSDVAAWVKLENYPPRIEIHFDDGPMLNIYGEAIVDRIREARGELVGELSEKFGMKARAGARMDGRWLRCLDWMTLYYLPD